MYRLVTLASDKTYEVEELVDVVFLPAVLEEIAAVSKYPDSPRWYLESCLLRSLERLGLVELVPEDGKTRSDSARRRVRKLPLLDAFIHFNP